MSKRRFRRAKTVDTAYPTLQDFDAGRRRFLAGLGGLLGAGALAACGSRPVPTVSDAQKPDAAPYWPPDGDPPLPDARADQMWLAGEPPEPDARLDSMGLSGGAPMPPAKLDGGCDDEGCPNP